MGKFIAKEPKYEEGDDEQLVDDDAGLTEDADAEERVAQLEAQLDQVQLDIGELSRRVAQLEATGRAEGP